MCFLDFHSGMVGENGALTSPWPDRPEKAEIESNASECDPIYEMNYSVVFLSYI